MVDIILKNTNGEDVIYNKVAVVRLRKTDGEIAEFVEGTSELTLPNAEEAVF